MDVFNLLFTFNLRGEIIWHSWGLKFKKKTTTGVIVGFRNKMSPLIFFFWFFNFFYYIRMYGYGYNGVNVPGWNIKPFLEAQSTNFRANAETWTQQQQQLSQYSRELMQVHISSTLTVIYSILVHSVGACGWYLCLLARSSAVVFQ